MKNASSQGASLSHRYLQTLLAIGLALMVASCKKDKEAPAVIEEVPAAAATAETDTSATLAEEPNLQQVGKDKPGSAKNTFHPSGKSGKAGKSAGKNALAPSASADKAGFSDAGHYVVQVAVFKSKHQAATLVEKLANSGYPAYVAEVENPVPALAGTYHRVRVGKFMTRTEARSFGENTLRPMGYEFWVDNKKNDAVGGDGSGAPQPEAAPVSRKSKKSAAAESVAPSEPAVPSGETWGNPKTTEPATPSGETWGNPKTEEPPATATPPAHEAESAPAEKPAAPPPAAKPPTPSATPASVPAKAPGDTGKVNLDEW